jgi:hypothetical protein
MTTPKKKLRCAYRSHKTGWCINLFEERGPKRYCSQRHQVRDYQERSGRRERGEPLRQAAIERDGGCVLANDRRPCRDTLRVRIVDPAKPRTLENVATVCTYHFAIISNRRFEHRVGPEKHRELKRMQGVEYMRHLKLLNKMGEFFGQNKWQPEP